MSTRNAEWWLCTTVTKPSNRDFPFLLDIPIKLLYICQSKGKLCRRLVGLPVLRGRAMRNCWLGGIWAELRRRCRPRRSISPAAREEAMRPVIVWTEEVCRGLKGGKRRLHGSVPPPHGYDVWRTWMEIQLRVGGDFFVLFFSWCMEWVFLRGGRIWQDLLNVLPPRVAARLTNTNLSSVHLPGRLRSQSVSTAACALFPLPVGGNDGGKEMLWWRRRRGGAQNGKPEIQALPSGWATWKTRAASRVTGPLLNFDKQKQARRPPAAILHAPLALFVRQMKFPDAKHTRSGAIGHVIEDSSFARMKFYDLGSAPHIYHPFSLRMQASFERPIIQLSSGPVAWIVSKFWAQCD